MIMVFLLLFWSFWYDDNENDNDDDEDDDGNYNDVTLTTFPCWCCDNDLMFDFQHKPVLFILISLKWFIFVELLKLSQHNS